MTRSDRPASTGPIGEGEVDTKFRRLGWNVWPTNNRDRGTDLIVLANDADRPVAFGVQAKAGPSYFRRKERDGNGNVSGWWYYEPSPRHFDYWTNHTLPHFVVLYDDDERTAYWVHVTADTAKSTGRAAKFSCLRTRRLTRNTATICWLPPIAGDIHPCWRGPPLGLRLRT